MLEKYFPDLIESCPEPMFQIKVGEPEKIGEGGTLGYGAYIVYKITAKTNLESWQVKEMTMYQQ